MYKHIIKNNMIKCFINYVIFIYKFKKRSISLIKKKLPTIL